VLCYPKTTSLTSLYSKDALTTRKRAFSAAPDFYISFFLIAIYMGIYIYIRTEKIAKERLKTATVDKIKKKLLFV